MKVYLDACCLNRLTDDQTQPRIHQEAEAVELLFKRMRDSSVQWISSEVLVEEIGKNPKTERRTENAALLALASETIEVNDYIAGRARGLQAAGAMDLSMRCTWRARKQRGPMSCSPQMMGSSRRSPVALVPFVLPYAIRYPGARKSAHDRPRQNE